MLELANSGAVPSPVELSEEDSEQWMTNPGSTFDDDIFVLGKKKVKLTRGEKKKLRQQYWGSKGQDEALERPGIHVLDLSAA